jgi:endogenous inhibitor of DNA gyrase (YacG/DUF329 family)
MTDEPPSDDRIVSLSARRGERCPVCSTPSVERYRPFCSKRCAQVDLGRWLKGAYRVPTDEAPAPGEAVETDEDLER